jgi:hypothetical protein
LKDARLRGLVEFAERYADGEETLEELNARWGLGWEIWGELASECPDDSQQSAEAEAAGAATRAVEGPHVNLDPLAHASEAIAAHVRDTNDVDFELGAAARVEERGRQIALIHDVFGNPFRPVNFDPEWRSDTALSLASHIYEARDFAQMPLLADALQDAGCDNADILSHCRDANGVHVRGCWVVDLVLGKE